MIFGTGFPPFRGGLLRHADSHRLGRVFARLDDLAERLGPRFAPADSIQRLANERRGFYPDSPTSSQGDSSMTDRPSFGAPADARLLPVVKSLFAGEIPEDTVFPFPEIDASERETVVGVSRLVPRIRPGPRRFREDRARALRSPGRSSAGWRSSALFGMSIPEEYGGYGFSASAYCRVTEEIGSTDASLGILIGGHQSIGLKGLILHGTEEQKKKWLPKLAAGEMIAAFALTEPEAGSDAASIKTTAVFDEAKNEFVLNGTKHWISNGGFAEFFTVFARDVKLDATDEHRRITAFVVTKDLGGVTPGKEESKLGLKGSSTVPDRARERARARPSTSSASAGRASRSPSRS